MSYTRTRGRVLILLFAGFFVFVFLIPGIKILDVSKLPTPGKYYRGTMERWRNSNSEISHTGPRSLDGDSLTRHYQSSTFSELSSSTSSTRKDIPETKKSTTKLEGFTVTFSHVHLGNDTNDNARDSNSTTVSRSLNSTKTTYSSDQPEASFLHHERMYNETFFDVQGGGFTDIIKTNPIKYLTNFKNPCWIESTSTSRSSDIVDGSFRGRLRCLPHFFVAGFPKCGTTDLYKRLVAHPDIVSPCMKEPHWWTRVRYSRRPMTYYLQCFDSAAQQISDSRNYTYITTKSNKKITMDCSASTAWDQSNWPLIPQNDVSALEPTSLNTHSILHLIPKAKFIIIMRNPTIRVYSDYLYFQLRNITSEAFHDKAARSIRSLESCFVQRSQRGCLYDKSLVKDLEVRINIGVYSVYIEDWLNLLSREQFLFLKTEEYGKNVTTSLVDVFKFLDVDVPDVSSLQEIKDKPKANTQRKSTVDVGPMLPKTQTMLDNFYGPFNEKLAELLHDSRYLWHKESH